MAQLSVEEIGKYSHSPAHYAVARRDYAGLQRIISALPRLAKAGEIRTELDSMAEERRADALAAVLDRRDVPGRETPLHLAVRLADASAAEMLMSAGADWSLQNEHGWSALQEAICSHQDVIAMVIMKHYQPAAWAKWCRRLPRVVATMRNMRDFYMELTFHFESSVIPFVGRIAPSDTYRIWKRGSNLRADMTLAGFDGFRIQRSDQSFLFLGDGSEDGKIQPGSLCMLGHKSKEVMNALEGAGTQPTEAEIAQEVAAMSRTNMYRPGIDVTQADLAPQLTWRRQEKTEMVGVWKAKIYDMHNVMVSVKSRRVPGAMTDEELFGAAEIDGDFDVENEHDDGDYADLLTEEERHQLEAALKQENVEIDEGCFTDERKSTRITTTTPARMSVDNAHHALRSKEKELRKSSVASSDHIVNLSKEEKKPGGWFGWGRKSFRHDNPKKADERDSELPATVATEADRESTAFPTRKKNHLKKDPFINNFTPARASFSVDDYSHSIDADITKPHRKSFKQETTRKMAPPRSSLCVENKVSDLLGENEKAALKYERGRRSVDARPDIKIDRSLIARKEKENRWRAEREAAAHRRKTSAATPSSEGSAESEYKKGLRPVLWLTPDFPLKTEELLPLLDILANKVKAVRRLRELLTTKLPTGTFPVKVAIPVVPTIRVVVTFTKFEELKPLEEFTTPPSSPTNDKASSQRHLGSWFSWIKGVAGMSASMDEHPENVTDPFRIPKDYTWTSMEAKRQRMKEKKSKGKKMKKTAAENSASETRV